MTRLGGGLPAVGGARGFVALALLAGALWLGAWPVSAAPRPAAAVPRPAMVRADLVSEVSAVAPGSTFWVGLRQRIAPGWHTYWINPGDSGEPASIEWTLPPGFSAGPVAWPYPHRIPVGPVMSFGYSDEVVLPVQITAPAGLAPGSKVTLTGRASWLVCEKACIPEEAPVALTLPVGPAAPDPVGEPIVAAARRAVPQPSPWRATFDATPEHVAITVDARGLAPERVGEVWFYPMRWGVIEHAAAQHVEVTSKRIVIRTARGQLPDGVDAPIEGVLVVGEKLDRGATTQAFALRAPRAGSAEALAGAGTGLLQVLALALLGGLVLNLMPCVLPVLSVKALSLVQHAGAGRFALAGHGAAYTAGVLASFGVLAGALIALRAGGEQIGWGFQLQSPWFVALLAYVLFAMALALSGALVIGGRLAGVGHGLASRGGHAGSFFTGALATVAATPCTAPFMGAAVGFAVTAPWGIALLVFQALGLGLALPYLLLTLMPAWRRFLPRPGAWMDRLKQLLAFPLYASVAWLVWVLSQQAGPPAVAAVMAGLVLIGFGSWLHAASRDARTLARRSATAVVAVAVAMALAPLPLLGAGAPAPRNGAAAEGGAVAEPFSATRLAQLRAEGRPVFVNFTAAWCITCLVNERVALRSPAVAQAFSQKGVVYLKGDWTRQDPQISRVLDTFGRSGVPLYLLYPPTGGRVAAGEPLVLPQILSEGMILDAVGKI